MRNGQNGDFCLKHDILLSKVAERVDDARVMRLLKLILKVSGKQGVHQGRVISPLLSDIYLNEVDKMLMRATGVTRCGRFTYIEYARFADDLVILVDGFMQWEQLLKAAYKWHTGQPMPHSRSLPAAPRSARLRKSWRRLR